MGDLLKRFIKEEDGATIIEYVLMLAVMAGIVMFAFPNLRTAIAGWITQMLGDVSTGLDNNMEIACPAGTTNAGTMVTDLSDCY